MSKTNDLIVETQSVLEQYDMPMTVRQIYYRLVAKGVIPNKIVEYRCLVNALVKARIAGRIKYEQIEDRTRSTFGGDSRYYSNEKHLDALIERISEFHETQVLPRWMNQPYYVEVWVEKQALEGVFRRAIDDLGVTLAVCRGYPSLTYLHQAAKRFEDKASVILYFGDYDPSGLDIQDSIRRQLLKCFEESPMIKRIAITSEQIERLNIPSVPAKETDPRTKPGDIAVELDAIEPPMLIEMIKDAIAGYFDEDVYQAVLKRQAEEQEELKQSVEETILIER